MSAACILESSKTSASEASAGEEEDMSTVSCPALPESTGVGDSSHPDSSSSSSSSSKAPAARPFTIALADQKVYKASPSPLALAAVERQKSPEKEPNRPISPLAATSQKADYAKLHSSSHSLNESNLSGSIDSLSSKSSIQPEEVPVHFASIPSIRIISAESELSLQSSIREVEPPEDFTTVTFEETDDGTLWPSGLVSSTINLLGAKSTPFLERKTMLQSKSIADFGSSTSLSNIGDAPGPPSSRSEMNLAQSSNQTVAEMKKRRTAIQITTFVNWINDRLKVGKNDRKVEDLFVDLRDGMLLIKLLENLTKKKVKGFTGKVPKTEAHKIVNLDLAFQFMESEKIKMVGVGGMNIYQGNRTLTLGMIWMLIQKYQMRIQGFYNVSTKQVMISWVQALLPKWNITNLTSDWRDGRVLVALINTIKPGIAPDVASLDPTKRRQNCVLATNVANNYLKIPKIISAEDLSSGNIDERSVMTYLSYFVEPFRVKLLKWVQKMLPQYNITGFTQDWYSGRAFGALLTACFSGLAFSLSQQDSPEDYARELLRVAGRKLGIRPPFGAADLISGKVEELQVMTMILLIRNSDLIPLPDEVIVYGPGVEGANFQKETSFVIDTTEAGPGQLFIDACYEDDGQKLKFALLEKTKRVFQLTYTPTLSSNVVFDILWSDVPVTDSPFTVPVTDATLIKILDFDSHNTLVEAGKPLSLIFEAKKAGQGKLSGYLQCGKEKIQAVATTLPNKTIRLDYTPTKPGTAVLHILWNGAELQHLSVTYTVVEIGGYSVRSQPKNRIYNVFEEPEFSVVSEKGLALNILQMTAVLSLDVQIAIQFSSIEGNLGHAHFTPTLPGEYRVEVVCVDQLIKGCPFTVRVMDPHRCKVQGEIPSFLQLSKPHTFEIDTQDAGVGKISFESSDHDISSLFDFSFEHPDSSDFQKLQVTPLVEGDFLVGIKYQHQWIYNNPFRVQICDPSKFAVAEQPKAANVGQPVQFTIRGKERCEGALKPVVRAVGPSAKYSPIIKTSEDGLQHYVEFTPWEVGDHTISVTYGGFDIPDTPIQLSMTTFDSNTCSAAGAGLQKAYTNVPAQFVILSKQEGLIEDGTLSIRIMSVMDQNECRIRARDNKDGTYNIAYLVQKTGAYLISIQTAGQHIPGSPFRLNVLRGPEAERCVMYGPALEKDAILMFGKPIDFTVDTSAAGAGKLSVKATGPEGTPARVFTAKTGQPGKYDISVDALCHGKHRVNVKWSNQHIPGSPFTIKVFPGADARKCVAYGPGLEDGRVGKKSSFTIETKNAGAGMLRVRLHGLKGAFKIEMAPADQKNRRTLLANYNPQLPGEYLITIKWSEVNIPGSPFRVKIFGDGTDSAVPIVFMPTPRPPDLSDFTDDTEDDDDRRMGPVVTNSGVRAITAPPPAAITAPPPPPTASRMEGPQQLRPTFRRGVMVQPPAAPAQVLVRPIQSQKMPTFANQKQQPLQQRKRKRTAKRGGGGGGGRGRVAAAHAPRKVRKRNEFDGQVTVHVAGSGKRLARK